MTRAASHTARVEIGDVGLAYREDGPRAAPALVLVNSLGTDLRMWDPQVPTLSRDFRVVRYDCRGHGASDVSRGPVTIAGLGDDVVALLDHLDIERSHVCGLSLGGLVAQWVAVHRPDRVERVVLANTAARIGTIEGWEARMRAVREGGMIAVRDAVVARFLGATFRAAHPEVARTIGDMVASTPADGYVAACEALRDADLRGDVASIRAPALVIAGGADESTPPELGAWLHGAMVGSELVILPGAAHLSNVERAEAFTSLVSRFLSA